MPSPNPIYDHLKTYLRTGFPTGYDWVVDMPDGVVRVSNAEMKTALVAVYKSNRSRHRVAEYLWRTSRRRDDISNAYHIDPSTLKRRCDKWMEAVLEQLPHQLSGLSIHSLKGYCSVPVESNKRMRDSLLHYMRECYGEYTVVQPWVFGEHTIPKAAIKDAIRKVHLTDPRMYSMAEHMWRASSMSKNSIAKYKNTDPSTLRRNWDKFLNMVLNWVLNGDIGDGELPPIDLGLLGKYNVYNFPRGSNPLY
ncbi:hypothetical protein [Microcoleus phage My-WqHQDG]|nr:hypothetical protein [Microcoleus phage My-WqHQDG]